MSWELIYTSAPRGLKPGSRGFCTVACTQGISPPLIERLEALSSYRNLFGPGDPSAKLNPVAYSHLVLTFAGRRLHVLSRIADAGLDYTQRTNKFAHHIVLESTELQLAGPASMLASPDFLRDRWEGDPAWMPPRMDFPRGDSPPGVCLAWQRIAGDAGWGGVLAESAMSGNRPATIIFQPGMEMLPLLVESMLLLPGTARWNITFSTYYTTLPAGVACQWRCLADGTPEAAAARREATATTLLDLCRPLPRAAGGALVEIARSGPKLAASSLPPPLHGPPPPPAEEELEYALKVDNLGSHGPIKPVVTEDADFGSADFLTADQPPRFPTRLRPKGAPRWPWVIAIFALILVLLSLLIITCPQLFKVFNSQKEPAGEPAVRDKEKADTEKAVEKRPDAEKNEKEQNEKEKGEKENKDEKKVKETNASKDGEEKVNDEKKANEQAAENKEKPDDNAAAKEQAEKEAAEKEKLEKEKIEKERAEKEAAEKKKRADLERPFDLPPCAPDTNVPGNPLPAKKTLSRFSDIETTNVEVLGLKDVLPAAIPAVWDNDELLIQLKKTKLSVERKIPIAKFKIEEHKLVFNWLAEGRELCNEADLFRNCVLRVKTEKLNGPALVSLREPKPYSPLSFEGFELSDTVSSEIVELESLPENHKIFLEVLGAPENWKTKILNDPSSLFGLEIEIDSLLRFNLNLSESKSAYSASSKDELPTKRFKVALKFSGVDAPKKYSLHKCKCKRDFDQRVAFLQNEINFPGPRSDASKTKVELQEEKDFIEKKILPVLQKLIGEKTPLRYGMYIEILDKEAKYKVDLITMER